MEIEIDKAEKLSVTGSSLLVALQNNSMPILDLLVREAIQNSLDAAKEDVDNVKVDFSVANFKSSKLNDYFDKINTALNDRYPNQTYKSLVITDTNTTGLDGPVSQIGLQSTSQYGNFWKLVYDIQKAQSTEGAGGSWGLGKTIYFRIGIGLVIYYTRVKISKGKYESRLAATLVENEEKYNCLLPKKENHIRTGIAWWGQLTENKETIPIVDEDYINNFLSVFSIEPFNENETGTKIIIPYINEKELLNSQVNEDDKENGPHIPWGDSIDDYLANSIYRWYTPRLFNVNYGRPYLIASVNKKLLNWNEMPQIYKLIRSLYNKALKIQEDNTTDYFKNNGIKDSEVIIDDIIFDKSRTLEKPYCVGTMASIKIKEKKILSLREPTPFTYLNIANDSRNEEANPPIILYTRKPGMIVNNLDCSKVSINNIKEDEYIIGVFVTNQETNFKSVYKFSNDIFKNEITNEIKVNNISVEEYVRKSELADHRLWADYPIFKNGETNTPKIINDTFVEIKKRLQSNFSEKTFERNKSFNSMLGELFGKMILPPLNFGNGPSLQNKSTKSGDKNTSNRTQVRKSTFKINEDNISYKGMNVIIPGEVFFVAKSNSLRLELRVDDESEGISWTEWENALKLDIPFYIKNLQITDKDKIILLNPTDNKEYQYDNVDYSFILSDKGLCIGIKLNNTENVNKNINVKISIEFINKEYKPTIYTSAQ